MILPFLGVSIVMKRKVLLSMLFLPFLLSFSKVSVEDDVPVVCVAKERTKNSNAFESDQDESKNVNAKSSSDSFMKNLSLPNDILLPNQWPIVGNYWVNIKAENAWSTTVGEKRVRVGVIDTGIKEHADLVDNLESGYDFYHHNSVTNEVTNGDHGTMVAGVIAATMNNTRGITGIAPNVSLVPLQAGDQGGVYPNAALEAINYATSLWGTDEQISVLNFSMDGYGFDLYDANGNETIFKQILDAIKNFPGVFVWALGNDNYNRDAYRDIEEYNANNIISVGAYDENGLKWEYSDYGFCTNIFAPGANIKSTAGTNEYPAGWGTSLAAPFVSATAALIYSKYPNLTAAKVKQSIVCSSKDTTINTNDGQYIVGYLRVADALSYAQNLSSSDPAYLRIGIDGKNGNSWTVSFINDNDYPVEFLWSEKTCTLQNAKNLSNLPDLGGGLTIAAKGKRTLSITENGSDKAIVGAIRQKASGGYGKRWISYTDGLIKEGSNYKSNRVQNNYQRTKYNYGDASSLGSYPGFLSMRVVGSSGWLFAITSWTIEIENHSNKKLTVEYNEKMCFEQDARSFSGLSDIKTDTVNANSTKNLTIYTNLFADYVVASIVFSFNGIDVRRVTYANGLSNNSIGTNKHSEILYLINGPVLQN